MASITGYPYIVKEETPRGERAVIENTSLAVWNIASDYYNRNLSVEKIAYRRDLTPAQVFSALAYYHDHRKEVDQARRDNDVELLCDKAYLQGIGETFRALVEVGKRHFWPRVSKNKNSILFAPLKNRRVALFTVDVHPVLNSQVAVWLSPEQFSRYYPSVTQEEVTKLLGPTTQNMTHSDVEAFAKGLDELVARNK
jgi:uncharacterized protein (DUF433 family)